MRARASSQASCSGSARGGCKNVLAAMKVRGMAVYGAAMPSEAGHAVPPAGAVFERRHRGLGGGGNLRAAVFGVNDGLVSNASLILGVAGATSDLSRRAERRRRHGRRRVRDGGRRIRVGAIAARALRIPDRARARRVEAVSGSRGAGARADLRGEGAAGEAGRRAREAPRRRSRKRARHAGARGARPQSRPSSARRSARQ